MIPYRDRNPSGTIPVVTVSLILINILIFAFEMVLQYTRPVDELQHLLMTYGAVPLRLRYALAGNAVEAGLYVMSIVTSMFLHGGLLHLISNMWFLWIFGDNIEDRLGHGRYLLFYLLCGAVAVIGHSLMELESMTPMVGASGAIAGVLGAYMVIFPRARVLTLVPIFYIFQIVELPAAVLLGVWFMIQMLSHLVSSAQEAAVAQSVAWMAHVGGFVAGVVLIFILPRRRGYRRQIR